MNLIQERLDLVILPVSIHQKEYWKKIGLPNVKPNYYVSIFGRVCSCFNGKYHVMSPTEDSKGYLQVGLATIDGNPISRKVHRLVMLTFCYIEGCEDLEVNHEDGNKKNNMLFNLTWVTPKKNTEHAIRTGLKKIYGEENPNSVLTDKQCEEVCELYLSGMTCIDIANKMGCKPHVINHIVSGNTRPYLKEKYNLQIRHPKAFTIEQIHYICKYFESNLTPATNKRIMFSDICRELGLEETTTVISGLYKLSNKSIYKDIVSQYTW